jgi:hypothetical protein
VGLTRDISENRGSTIQRFPNFPRNLAPDFTHYISERPEMTSSKQGVKEGQKQEKEIKL